MTPKNKLFIGILILGLIVNLLIIFNLNYFYIRAILAFVFIITIPGLLIMLCLKIRNINFWEYLVYTIGLSVAFIMFAGLAVNWILPFLNITNKPISLWPILICFDTILLALWIIAHKRNEDNAHILIFPFQEYEVPKKLKSLFSKTSQTQNNKGQSSKSSSMKLNEISSTYQNRQLTLPKKFRFIPKFPNLSWLDRIFFIVPIFFPFMAVVGAFLLNNHGTNIVTMIMLASIAVYVLLLVIFREKLNENVYPWALWMIGLSLLLSFSMRSWYVSGVDTNLEFSIFPMTQDKGIWLINNFKNAYNVMLSVTILPNIFSFFSNINPQYIQKLFFSLIFNFVPLIVYIISRKFFDKNISFFAGLFFIFQLGFMKWSEIPSRQQIAFLFFGLMFLILFNKEIDQKIRNLMFVIFGFSMIISHYSTSYIAFAIFLFAYIYIFFYKRDENRKIKKDKTKPEQKQEFYLTGVLILVLLVFGFLWYSQISDVASGPINFMKDSFINIDRIFEENVQSQGNSPLDQFNIFPKQQAITSLLKEYEEGIVKDYPEDITQSTFRLYPIYPPGIKQNLNQQELFFLFSFRGLLKVLGKVFLIFGVFCLFIKRKDHNLNFIVLNIACFLILIILLILPFISIQYDVIRTYQQVLILLSGTAMFGALIMLKKIPKINAEILLSIFLIFYFLALSGIFHQISGGTDVDLRLNNVGLEYSPYYVHKIEIESSVWLKNYSNIQNRINSDGRAFTRLFLSFNPLISYRLTKDVQPPLINKNNYVYSSYSNNFDEISYKFFKGGIISFNFPTDFLNDNKNLIYNNGGSEIFK